MTELSITYATGVDRENWQIRDMVKCIAKWCGESGDTWHITKHHRGGFQYLLDGKKPAKGHKIIVTAIAAAEGEP